MHPYFNLTYNDFLNIYYELILTIFNKLVIKILFYDIFINGNDFLYKELNP